MIPDDFDNWSPLTPREVAARFAAFPGPWWIAGGWAIDLFVGRQTRPHEDVDIVVLRRDQRALHDMFPGWKLFAADPPGTMRPWPADEFLPPSIIDIWGRQSLDNPWALQVMLQEDDGDRWRFRRDGRIGGLIANLGEERDGIPILAPEVQLLYKSKSLRPKDEHDFAHALPLLDQSRHEWLAAALVLTRPDHPWLPLLRDVTADVNRQT